MLWIEFNVNSRIMSQIYRLILAESECYQSDDLVTNGFTRGCHFDDLFVVMAAEATLVWFIIMRRSR